MEFIITADWHLLWENPIARLDNAHETQFGKVQWILDYAKEQNAQILLAGDMFDKPRNWHVLPRISELLKRNWERSMPCIFCVRGQHDKYMLSEDTQSTSLGMLEKQGLVAVIEDSLPLDNEVLYGCSWGGEIPKLDETRLDRQRILIIHAPIYMNKVYDGQDNKWYAPKFLKDHPEFDLIVCGDTHQRFIYQEDNRIICNSGPIFRKEAIKYNFEHEPHIGLYDTETKKLIWIPIPCEPAEKVLSREHLESTEHYNELMTEFILAVADKAEVKGASFEEILMELVYSEKVPKEVKRIIGDIVGEGFYKKED